MKKSYIKKRSLKKIDRDRIWNEITDQKCAEEGYYCQWCGKSGHRRDKEDWNWLDGHHIIPRRFNIHTKDNCYIVHRAPCHGEVDKIDLEKYPNHEVWEAHQ